MTKYPDSICEKHKNVTTDQPVCIVCMQQEIDLCRRDLEEALIDLYKLGRMPVDVAVAKLCDEKLDRSGALLGRIRHKVNGW